MRFPSRTMVIAGCVSLAMTKAAFAADPDPQCQDKPNFTNVAVSISSAFFMEGGNAETVSDDVLMIDFAISAENAGGAEADGSRIDYTAKIMSTEGRLVESLEGVASLYWMPAGGQGEALASVMASKLAPLVQSSGEIAGTVAFRAIVDADNQIAECDETDNKVETTLELSVSAETQQS